MTKTVENDHLQPDSTKITVMINMNQ